jgi:16S rRNA (uracil1498-N3)-methyltransferase
MHRFYLSPEQCQGDFLTLTGSEAHHALKVLRIQPGARVIVLNGIGAQFLCEVTGVKRGQAALSVLERQAIAPLPYQLTLAQALPKGKLFDSIVQKATELGATEIVPLLTERVVAHLDSKDQAQKLHKWQAVAIEALKQCGSAWLPRLTPPLAPQQLVKRASEFELGFVGSLQAGAQHPRHYLKAFQSEQGRLPRSVCVWIGPEGDFTSEELKLIRSSGACPITLGPLVLRTETAALYCLSILNYELTFGVRD